MNTQLLSHGLGSFHLGSIADVALVGSWWTTFFAGLSHMVGTQRGMVQFAFIGMFLALIVIWWRK